MTDLERLGPIYDLGDGTRLQDLNGGCGSCSKRLAEVVHDPSGHWREQAIVCIDCGWLAPATDHPAHRVTVKPSWRSPGQFIASCPCRFLSPIASRAQAQAWADEHRTNNAA